MELVNNLGPSKYYLEKHLHFQNTPIKYFTVKYNRIPDILFLHAVQHRSEVNTLFTPN